MHRKIEYKRHKTIIIAEIGENHIGDLKIAKELIKKASEAGADYVKFQSYRPETFKQNYPGQKWFKEVFLSDKAHYMLKDHADKTGIKFLSSPFSVERARFLCEDLGLKEIKIASSVMLNIPILDYINKHAETAFLSTGMASIPEIKEAVNHLNRVKKCYILHCVSQYPCKYAEVNLCAITAMQKEFPNYEIGYSDHTIGCLAPIIAVALGAKIIEKHFTFDKKASKGYDHVLSAEPEDLKEMINKISHVESLLGKCIKRPTAGEEKIKVLLRNRFA